MDGRKDGKGGVVREMVFSGKEQQEGKTIKQFRYVSGIVVSEAPFYSADDSKIADWSARFSGFAVSMAARS